MPEEVFEIEKVDVDAAPNNDIIKKKQLRVKGKTMEEVKHTFLEIWNE